jgi:hypothetical protein
MFTKLIAPHPNVICIKFYDFERPMNCSSCGVHLREEKRREGKRREEKRREEKRREEKRHYIWRGGDQETIFPVLKFPRQCPLVLLVEV